MFDHNFIGFRASHNALSMTNLSLNPKPKEHNMIVDDMERNRLKVQIKKHCGSYYTWTIFPWPLHVGQMDSCFKIAFCITTWHQKNQRQKCTAKFFTSLPVRALSKIITIKHQTKQPVLKIKKISDPADSTTSSTCLRSGSRRKATRICSATTTGCRWSAYNKPITFYCIWIVSYSYGPSISISLSVPAFLIWDVWETISCNCKTYCKQDMALAWKRTLVLYSLQNSLLQCQLHSNNLATSSI